MPPLTLRQAGISNIWHLRLRDIYGPGGPNPAARRYGRRYNPAMFPDNADSLLEATRAKYREFVNPGLERLMSFAGFGLEWNAEGCYLYDAQGNRYLDCLGGYGVFSLGHKHPKVVDAVRRQLDRMPLSGKVFFNQPLADFAEKLAAITPGDLRYSFLCNSGTEAVEGALKVARRATGRHHFVATVGAFHGKSMGSLSASGRDAYKTGFDPLVPGFMHVPFGDAEAVAEVMDDDTAGVIVEPIQGEGGIRIPSDEYLPALREICDRHGALLIADEVQTGLGRTGAMFAVNHFGVVPDLMTLAKCLGGGVMPAGAFVGTPEVWEKGFGDNPLIHTSTFGGNPMAAVAGIAAINVIEEERLADRAREMGDYLVRGLNVIKDRFPGHVSEIRGRGLMIGIEFTQDDVGELCIGQMTMRGMVAAYTLNNPRVIRIEPPLIISREQCDFALTVFEEALSSTVGLLEEIGV